MVYLNKENASIFNRFIGAIFLGSVGLLITMIFTLKSDDIKETFTTTLILDKDSKLPINPKNIKLIQREGMETMYQNCFYLNYNQDTTQKEQITDFTNCQLLMKRIVDIYRQRFVNNWQVEPFQYNTSMGEIKGARFGDQSKKIGQLVIKENELNRIFKSNPFFGLSQEVIIEKNLNLPPKTKIEYSDSLLTLKNCFVTIRIKLEGISSGGIAVGPAKKLVFHDNVAKDKVKLNDIAILCEIDTSDYLSGHSNFEENLNWAKAFIEAIKKDLDVSEKWKEIE